MVAVVAPAPRSERSHPPSWRYQWITLGIVLVLFELRLQYHQQRETGTTARIGTPKHNSSSSNDDNLREEVVHQSIPSSPKNTKDPSPSDNDDCDPNIVYRGPAGLPVLKHRYELGPLLEERNFRDGAELGVQRAHHARDLLTHWPSCQHFHLVDLWGYQGQHYQDPANRPQTEQDLIFGEAQSNLQLWTDRNITTFYRMRSVDAAPRIANHSLDFIYIDARHDYCGVLEDLRAYYPKIRPGGILAGHDFLSVAEQKQLDPNQDWSLCSDGVTVHPGAVKGAVETFALQEGLSFSVMYGTAQWTSWMMQKPTRMECVKEGEMGAYGSDLVGSQ